MVEKIVTGAVTGWAVSTTHGIDIRTVGPTRRAAIVNWLVAGEHNEFPCVVLAFHTDAQIERMWRGRSARSGAYAVEVVITEART